MTPAALVLVAGLPQIDNEGRRVALVIGNATYQHVPVLSNPANDANAMAKALRRLGFDVVPLIDGTRPAMVRSLREFRAKLSADGVGLFYYAGHAVQVRDKNYLIPVEADIAGESDTALLTIDLEAVEHEMEDAGVRLSLFILDACRDNPFERRFRAAGSRGLAPIDAPRGSVIAFATAPGKTAADGTGPNGLYTGELLKAMTQPGLELEEVLKRAAEGVERASGNRQTPWYNSAFHGHFFFASPVREAAPPPQPSPSASDKDLTFWTSIKTSNDPADFEDFLKRFPQSEFASLAQRRLAALRDAPRGPAGNDMSAGIPTWTPDEKREVQRALRSLGYFQGNADGNLGADTRAAVRRFQSFEGIPETGSLSDDDRRTLSDKAHQLAALLSQAAVSPRGVAAGAVKGGAARYARAWAFDSGNSEKGATSDQAEAVYWYALAAVDGEARAFINLGRLMVHGQGISKADPSAAVLLWQVAAARGDAIAMFNLGALYEHGVGVPADTARARSWYERAAALNHADARAALRRLGSSGSDR